MWKSWYGIWNEFTNTYFVQTRWMEFCKKKRVHSFGCFNYMRIYNGWFIFKWWLRRIPKDVEVKLNRNFALTAVKLFDWQLLKIDWVANCAERKFYHEAGCCFFVYNCINTVITLLMPSLQKFYFKTCFSSTFSYVFLTQDSREITWESIYTQDYTYKKRKSVWLLCSYSACMHL